MLKTAILTGCAGFIGNNLLLKLLKDGWHVYGIDKLDTVSNPTRATPPTVLRTVVATWDVIAAKRKASKVLRVSLALNCLIKPS